MYIYIYILIIYIYTYYTIQSKLQSTVLPSDLQILILSGSQYHSHSPSFEPIPGDGKNLHKCSPH